MRQRIYTTFVSLLLSASLACSQAMPAEQNPQAPAANPGSAAAVPAHAATTADKRRAAKLYLAATKLYEAGEFEQALAQYQKAADLDPANNDYGMAVAVTRSHAVTALIQAAAKARTEGNKSAARASLAHALELDPQNANVNGHLLQLADDTTLELASPRSTQVSYRLAPPEDLAPTPGTQSFHLRTSQRQLIQQVFKAYGIDATVDDSISANSVRFDLEDASFAEAIRSLSLATNSFPVTIDPHRVLVARDTTIFRTRYERNAVENIPLLGLTQNEMNDVLAVSKNVFQIQHSNLDAGASTLSVEATPSTLNAFNATWRDLSQGRPEVMIDIKVIQLVHNSARTTGAQLPQTVTAFNVYAEEQSILNANQSLVQQIISSGLAAPGDTLAILGILLASGQVSSSIFSNGIALFGGGLTTSGLSPGPVTFNLNLNSSDSRELDNFQFRLEDGEEGTLKSGMRYPIMTSSYSSLTPNSLNIPGLTSAGNSSALSGLLSQLSSAANVPTVDYQDIGLTLKATPHVLRSGDVALNIDMKITSLAGTSINSVPVIANESYTGMATMRANEAVVIAGEMDESEIRAVSGTPGISEIPGLNNITDKNVQKNTATLLIIMTPRIVRSTHGIGHSPMQIMERTAQAR
jgi:type II secretory pathway component GspD/PulD (secretin)